MSSAWEGLPISLIEATASGLPFIATDVGGCRELAYLCGNGVIVPPGDAQALAGALTALVEDSGRRAALSKAAIAKAGKLSIEAAADEHLRLYAASSADGRDDCGAA
jgi:glycosyltransferase involved in cell wall biosynthesis